MIFALEMKNKKKKENKGTLLGIILGLFGLTWLAADLSNKYWERKK